VEIYLPIAGISVNLFFLIGLGAVVGFLSGLFGVGGGFLLTPLLIMIGIPPSVAAASSVNQLVATSVSGAYAHKQMGHVDVRLGLVILLGGIIGGTLGVQAVLLLREGGVVDIVIKLLYVGVLGFVGSFMFYEGMMALRNHTPMGNGFLVRVRDLLCKLPFQTQMEFRTAGIKVCPVFPFTLGLVVGVLLAIMGVGGGFLLVPALIYILGVPTLVSIGTSLFQIVFTTMHVTFLQAVLNHNVDMILALLLLVGAVLGAQWGARYCQKVQPDRLRIFLAILIFLIVAILLVDLVRKPEFLVSIG
jgi:uncharacterized membrane protein YfcA